MPDKQLTIAIKSLSRFLVWSKQYCWMSLLVVIIAGSLVALTVSLAPLVAGQLLTHALPGGNQLLLQYLPLVLACLLITAALANLAGHYTLYRIGNKLALELRVTIFTKLLMLQPVHPDASMASITSLFFNHIEKLYFSGTHLAINLSRDLFTAVGLLVVMIYLSQEMSLLAFTLLTAAYLIDQIPRINVDEKNRLSQPGEKISEIIYKSLHHYRTIYLDQGNIQESQHIRQIFEQYRKTSQKHHNHVKLVELIAVLFLIGMLTAFLYYLIQQLILGKLIIGDTVAFITAMLLFIFPLKRLLQIKPTLEQCSRTLQIIFSLLDQQIPSVPENPNGSHLKHARGKLNFRHVKLRDDIALKPLQPPISLDIAPGEKIALTNVDNQTKRSLADLICGFLCPTNGRIQLDNRDINQIIQTDLYANIVWIVPDRILLTDTIAANIAYGAMHCSPEAAITSAAYASHATEFIREMPHGFQTKINNQDISLSDHQRQRILIARALLKKPAIVIIDETSAYFDTDSLPVLNALSTLTKDRTTLILSHRPVITSLATSIFKLRIR